MYLSTWCTLPGFVTILLVAGFACLSVLVFCDKAECLQVEME